MAKHNILFGCALSLLSMVAFAADESDKSAAAGDKPYSEHIQCEGDSPADCKIDLYLTRGTRAFSNCQPCHGLDANGSSFAPSLVQKLQEIDQERFNYVLEHGYKGQMGVMPAWKENPNLMKYVDQLYLYLLARSDGVIPPGKIQRYDR